jgi:hypothetical protein
MMWILEWWSGEEIDCGALTASQKETVQNEF